MFNPSKIFDLNFYCNRREKELVRIYLVIIGVALLSLSSLDIFHEPILHNRRILIFFIRALSEIYDFT